jgi:hypothetical protein
MIFCIFVGVAKTPLSMARDKYHYEFREALEKDQTDIVIGFLSPKMREFSDYATG